MPDITIPDVAVEAAARALDANFNPDRYPIMAAMFRDYASTALAAAAPYIAAQALRDAADIWQINGWTGDGSVLGPSRPQQILGMAQRACDFLRARAARIEADHG